MQSIKSENAKIPMKELCAVRMDFRPNTAISTKTLPKLPISSEWLVTKIVGYGFCGYWLVGCGLVWNLKKSVAVTQIVGVLVGYHLFSSKNVLL